MGHRFYENGHKLVFRCFNFIYLVGRNSGGVDLNKKIRKGQTKRGVGVLFDL